ENVQIQSARKAVENFFQVRQRIMNLVHVALNHDVGQPAGLAQCLNVLLRTLHVPLVAERQRAMEKMLSRLCTHRDELLDRESFQRRPRRGDLSQVAPNDTTIDRGNKGLDLASPMILNLDLLKGFIATTKSKCGDMRYAHVIFNIGAILYAYVLMS